MFRGNASRMGLPPDITPPISSVDQIEPYWQNADMIPFEVTVTASDDLTGVAKVELWYRHSTDNLTWGPWTLYGVDTAAPWSWSFDAPLGDCYYEFYSIAIDVAGNVEAAPAVADISVGVDTIAPEITAAFIPIDVEENEGLFRIEFTATDAKSGVEWVTAVIAVPDLDIPVELEVNNQIEYDFDLQEGYLYLSGPNPDALLAELRRLGGISVANGEFVEIEQADELEFWAGYDEDYLFNVLENVLNIEAVPPDVTLVVRAMDVAGNEGVVSVTPIFVSFEAPEVWP